MKITGGIPEEIIYIKEAHMKKPTLKQSFKTVGRAVLKVGTRPFKNDDIKAITKKKKRR